VTEAPQIDATVPNSARIWNYWLGGKDNYPVDREAGDDYRASTPRSGDVFRNMSGPTSWAVSLGLGLAGALVGYVIFTLGLGIGDTDIFDWGGLLSALIGTFIVLGLAGYFLRRRQPGPPVQ
jgi:uncharacterized membrane protein YeaQ/YmgE (transglycosylase-associated protein family)